MPKLLRVAPLAAALLLLPLCGSAQSPIPPLPKTQRTDVPAFTPWLFIGFKGNSEDGVYYALSPDGYHWTLANGGQPVVHQTEPNELMRDPFIARGPDGVFHMVWTWSWRTPTVVGHATSKDLIRWTRHQQLPVMANEPATLNVWAPALSYEPDHKRWLITFPAGLRHGSFVSLTEEEYDRIASLKPETVPSLESPKP